MWRGAPHRQRPRADLGVFVVSGFAPLSVRNVQLLIAAFMYADRRRPLIVIEMEVAGSVRSKPP